MKVRELLSRRNDLSTFLVHLTRDWEEGDPDSHRTAQDSFRRIIGERRLLAGKPQGFAREQDDPADPIPLWSTRGRCSRTTYSGGWRDWLVTPINELKDEAVGDDFHTQPIARLLPFFDWMGGPFPGADTSKEFWWEREWRHQRDLALDAVWDKVIWLCPASEHEEFTTLVEESAPGDATASPIFIDPSWGLEEIVAHLAGLAEEDVSVFAASRAGDSPDEPPPVL
jgi:hypothetical protein